MTLPLEQLSSSSSTSISTGCCATTSSLLSSALSNRYALCHCWVSAFVAELSLQWPSV